MSNSKLILGLIAGAAIGGALGILFAPDKGAETRRKLSKKGEDLSDTIKDQFNDFVDGVKENFSSTKKEAKNAMP